MALVVGGDEFYKHKRPNKLHADSSGDSLPDVTSALNNGREKVATDVPEDMLARVTQLGYPPSAIDAAIKWRTKVKARKTSKHK